MGWKIVTDKDGQRFFEGDLQMAVGVAERNTFLRVAPPDGVANFPVGPKAPEWVLQSQQRAAAALTDMLDVLGVGSIKSAPGTGPGSPDVVQSVKPKTLPTALTESSAWNLDALRAMITWPNPYLPEIKPELPQGYVDTVVFDEAYEMVNGDGEVVRRDPVEDSSSAVLELWKPGEGRSAVSDPTTDTSKWTLPAADLQPWQADLVQKMFGGLSINASPSLRPGDALVFNPADISGRMSTSTGARWINDPATAPPPTPEPPKGRFQNLDWD